MSIMYRFLRAIARLVVWIWAPLSVSGHDRFPSSGPALLVANHRSLLDGLLLMVLSDRSITFLAAAYLFRIPLVGWVLRQVALPTGSVTGVRQSLQHLQQGGLVAVFPEGGVRTANSLEGLGDSAAYLASRSGAVVVPVAIRGADAVLPLGKLLPRRRRPVHVLIGQGRHLPPGGRRADLMTATQEWMAEIYSQLD